ncbi:MAG TPA: DUF1905 domain-containing protein [Candidatus Limnocylindrales bacterium]|nr:DUF1905 domain-containing protein [Candidatus Limnocylindrales bacterium]
MVTFRATIELRGKTACGMSVPPEVVAALGHGKRPPVTVTIHGSRTGAPLPSTDPNT